MLHDYVLWLCERPPFQLLRLFEKAEYEAESKVEYKAESKN